MRRLDMTTRTIFRIALVVALTLNAVLADSGEATEDPYWSRNLASYTAASPGADGRPATLPARLIPPPVASPKIDLGFSRVRTVFDGTDLTVTSITGGLPHSVFGFAAAEAMNPPELGGTFPLPPPHVFSVGLPSLSNPASGALSWAGTLVGTDGGSGLHGSTILGGVDIVISDFLNPRAEIAFRSLIDFDAKTSLDPMAWSDVPIKDGAFAAGTAGNRVEGRFYGPDHQEVGGTFESVGIVGAFGAQRVQATMPPQLGTRWADLSEPPGFLASVSRALLTGDFTFEGIARSSSQMGSSAALAQLADLQSTVGEASLDFGPSTVGLRGSIPSDGMRHWRVEWLSKLGIGVQGFELELDLEFTGLLSWLRNGGTFVGESQLSFVEGIEGISLPDVNITYQTAFGSNVLVTPFHEGAQWNGSIAGKDISAIQASGDSIAGNANLTITDLSPAGVDVEFTNVIETRGGGPRTDMAWTAVPVSGGVFRSNENGDTIQGIFLGPSTDEAVGIFERDGVFGTFSTVRSDSTVSVPDSPTRSFEVLAYLDTLNLESISNAVAAFAADPNLLDTLLASATLTQSTHNGIAFTEARSYQIPVGREAANFEVLGGWLEHGFFAVTGIRSGPLDAPVSNNIWAAVTLGHSAGSNPPSGRARWAGAMQGIDVSGSATHGNRVRGDASIAFEDVRYANVDVVFTEVVDLSTNSLRSDMEWWGIPLSAGAFEASVGSHRVSGQFFGPRHEEVAGTFHWHDILGAFGAKRTQP